MIQFLGGFSAAYVQGLYLIIMGMVVVVPLAFRETIILYVLIWASYAVPGFLNLCRTSSGDWRDVFTNLFFLTAIVVLRRLRLLHHGHASAAASCGAGIQLEETTAKLRESNLKLKTLDKLKTQFFANVNHELRTPLTLMLAPLGPMLDGQMGRIDGQAEGHRSLTIRHNGFKLLKLINNLLDLTKLEEGKMRLKIKTVDFVEYVNALLASVKPLTDRKKIKLYFQHPSAQAR